MRFATMSRPFSRGAPPPLPVKRDRRTLSKGGSDRFDTSRSYHQFSRIIIYSDLFSLILTYSHLFSPILTYSHPKMNHIIR
jgi:hypothetical protein